MSRTGLDIWCVTWTSSVNQQHWWLSLSFFSLPMSYICRTLADTGLFITPFYDDLTQWKTTRSPSSKIQKIENQITIRSVNLTSKTNYELITTHSRFYKELRPSHTSSSSSSSFFPLSSLLRLLSVNTFVRDYLQGTSITRGQIQQFHVTKWYVMCSVVLSSFTSSHDVTSIFDFYPWYLHHSPSGTSFQGSPSLTRRRTERLSPSLRETRRHLSLTDTS